MSEPSITVEQCRQFTTATMGRLDLAIAALSARESGPVTLADLLAAREAAVQLEADLIAAREAVLQLEARCAAAVSAARTVEDAAFSPKPARYAVFARGGGNATTCEITPMRPKGALEAVERLLTVGYFGEIVLRREGWVPPPEERLHAAAADLLAAAKDALNELEAHAEDDGRDPHLDPAIEDLRRAIHRATAPADACPGHGRCHGSLVWCDECGDTSEMCSDPTCFLHHGKTELR